MSETTAVFFDVDGTLVEFDRSYAAVLEAAAESVGLEPTDDLLEAYDETFFDRFSAFAEDPYRDAAAAAIEAVGADADPDAAVHTSADAFAEAVLDAEFASTVVEDGTCGLLDRLGDRHRLGVLSNGVPAVQRGKLARHGLADCFDAHVYSYDVGAHKPDPAVFEAAATRLPADRHVYVADDREGDVEPAREAGWLAVHVDRDGDGSGGRVTVPGFDALDEFGTLFASR